MAHLRLRVAFAAIAFLLITGISQAVYQFNFDIFTSDGLYCNDPRVDMYMEVSNGVGYVDFTFYNISSVESSLARIYFDDGSLLGISSIINSPGTEFSEAFPGPGNLPAGETLTPPFVADREFTIGAVQPPPQNGVNPPPPDEWVKINFDLVSGGTLEGVISELNSGVLRVGIHIIALPDGSSESAIAIPEPATLFLLAAGATTLLRRRRN
jgi:hypothetical protein